MRIPQDGASDGRSGRVLVVGGMVVQMYWVDVLGEVPAPRRVVCHLYCRCHRVVSASPFFHMPLRGVGQELRLQLWSRISDAGPMLCLCSCGSAGADSYEATPCGLCKRGTESSWKSASRVVVCCCSRVLDVYGGN